MTAAVRHLPATANADEVCAILMEDGCVIVDNLAGEDRMDRLAADMKPWFDARAKCHDDFSGYRTRRVSALVARSEAGREIATEPLVLEVCDRLLLPNCESYHLQVTHMVDIGPGEVRQQVHRDDGIFPESFRAAMPDLVTLVHCMWAVSDFTFENGATTLVPGSHRWADLEREPEEHEITQAAMAKGSVAFYLGAARHGGGANRSNGHRVGALFGYELGWLRQEENMYLTCPPAVAKTFPERLQRLIGYEMFNRTAGWVDDVHPIALLKDDADFDALRVL